MKTDYDVIIIGMGPAGITSALYLKRANLNCLIIEKNAPGGLLNKTSTVENYPGIIQITGPDLAYKFYEQLNAQQIPQKFEEVKEVIDVNDYKKVVTNKGEYTTKKIIIAIGREPKKLKNTNEERLEGKGISFCSLCDGTLYKNEEVSIIGGGNSALEEALYLSDICKKVTIINKSNSLKGDSILIDKVNNKENIEVINNSEVKEFHGKNDKLEYVTLKTDKEDKDLYVKACFIFIGYEPATKFLKNLDILDEKGYINVDETRRTKIKGIYAAGDIVKKEAYQIITASSDGAIAAVSCIKDLMN
jgi:thioredoxin reductase (NADPH)